MRRSAAGDATDRRVAIGSGRGPSSSARTDASCRSRAATSRLEHGRHHRRHVAPDDEDALDGRVEGMEPGRQRGQRPLERKLVAHGGRTGSFDGDVRWPDHHDLRRDRADGVDRVVQHLPAVDRFHELVASEPGRAAPGEDDRRDPLAHGATCAVIARRRRAPSGRGRARRASGAGSLGGRGPRGWPSRTCGSSRSHRGMRRASTAPSTPSRARSR